MIFSVPNVIKTYKNVKSNTFLIQSQNIYKAVINQMMINGEKVTSFCYAGENESLNPVNLKGNKEIYYFLGIKDEKIVKMIVSTSEYSINIGNGINEVDIKKTKSIRIKFIRNKYTYDEKYRMGVVAYLAQSSYEKNSEVWINPSENYYTGCSANSVDNINLYTDYMLMYITRETVQMLQRPKVFMEYMI